MKLFESTLTDRYNFLKGVVIGFTIAIVVMIYGTQVGFFK